MRFIPCLCLAGLLWSPAAVATEEPGPEAAVTIGVGALWFIGDADVQTHDATPAWSVRYGWDGGGMIGMDFAWTVNTGVEQPPAQQIRFASFLESDIKFILAPRARFTPFAAAGVGFGAFLGAPENTDWAVFTLPLSAGAEIRGDRFIIAGRATWRRIFADETRFTVSGADHLATMVEVGQRF